MASDSSLRSAPLRSAPLGRGPQGRGQLYDAMIAILSRSMTKAELGDMLDFLVPLSRGVLPQSIDPLFFDEHYRLNRAAAATNRKTRHSHIDCTGRAERSS